MVANLRLRVEIWNRIDDLGAAVRSTERKPAELADSQLIECWLLVDTVANRALVRRYPTIFRSRFPASSAALVRALSGAASLPRESTSAWIDLRAATLRPMRFRDERPTLPGSSGSATVPGHADRRHRGEREGRALGRA